MSQHQPSTPPRADSAPNAPRPTQSIAELYAAIAQSRGTQSPGQTGAAVAAGSRSQLSAAAAASPASPSPLAALLGPIAAAAAAAAAAASVSAASHSVAATSSPATAAAAAGSPSSDRPPLQFSSVSHDEFGRSNKQNPWHSNSNAARQHAAAAVGGAASRTPARAASAAAAAMSSPRTASPTAASTAAKAASARPSKPPSGASPAASAALSSSVFSTVGVYRSPLTSRPLVRTLVVLLLALVGSRVKIDLRNESVVRGLLESVDKQGNMTLVAASTQRPGEKSRGGAKAAAAPTLEFMFLPARSVRFVHIPASLGDAGTLLTHYEQRLDSNLLEYQRKKRLGRYTTREAQRRNVAQKEAKLAREIAAEEAAAAAEAAAADPAALEARKEETKRKQRASMAGGPSTWTPPADATSHAPAPTNSGASLAASPSAAAATAAATANQPQDESSNKRRKI